MKTFVGNISVHGLREDHISSEDRIIVLGWDFFLLKGHKSRCVISRECPYISMSILYLPDFFKAKQNSILMASSGHHLALVHSSCLKNICSVPYNNIEVELYRSKANKVNGVNWWAKFFAFIKWIIFHCKKLFHRSHVVTHSHGNGSFSLLTWYCNLFLKLSTSAEFFQNLPPYVLTCHAKG